eukprot:359052-Chlamydomonas_euryale.AAC.1
MLGVAPQRGTRSQASLVEAPARAVSVCSSAAGQVNSAADQGGLLVCATRTPSTTNVLVGRFVVRVNWP